MGDSDIRSRFVVAGGIRTHYSEAGGDGPVVVLCHGGGAGSSGAAGFSKIMPALAERFRVIAPDGVGGYGLTDVNYDAKEGVQSRVDQLGYFMDALAIDELCIAGNSMGAWVAAKYALEHPDRVKKLFLIASATIANAMGVPAIESEGMKLLRSFDGTPEGARRSLKALLYHEELITEELVQSRLAAANRPGAAEARKKFEAGQKRLTTDPNLRLKFDMRHTLPNLQIPTTFIWGENDIFALPELGHQLQKLLPNVPFTFIPEAAHQVQNDQPEKVSRMMLEFFGS